MGLASGCRVPSSFRTRKIGIARIRNRIGATTKVMATLRPVTSRMTTIRTVPM